jgi:hypothetical protein
MKRVKFWALVIAPLSLLFLAQPRPGRAAFIGLKFYGGFNSMDGGDLNIGLKGWLDAYKEDGALWGVTSVGDYQPFHGGMDVGGDLIIHFTPALGIGFGASIIQAKSSTRISYSSAWGGPGELRLTPQATVIPIRAGLYASISLGSLVGLSLNGGAEYYLAKFKYTVREEGATYWQEKEANLDSRGKVGFFAGLGFELKLHRNVSIVLEGRGRLGQIDGFEGQHISSSSYAPTDTTDNVKLWYMKANLPIIGQYRVISVSTIEPPLTPDIQDVRSARLDLKGYCALGGLMLRF